MDVNISDEVACLLEECVCAICSSLSNDEVAMSEVESVHDEGVDVHLAIASNFETDSESCDEEAIDELESLFTNAQYFLLKSVNKENIVISKERGVWSTPPGNERRLNAAFRESRNVVLIYSVTVMGHFQGFARMMSEAEPMTDDNRVTWVLPPGLNARAFTGVIPIDWISKNEVPFTETTHLTNAYNDNKLVRFGRDGQEIDPVCGEALCRLIADSIDPLSIGPLPSIDTMDLFGVPDEAFQGTYADYVRIYKEFHPDEFKDKDGNDTMEHQSSGVETPTDELILKIFYTQIFKKGVATNDILRILQVAAIKHPDALLPIMSKLAVLLKTLVKEDEANEQSIHAEQ